VPIDPKSIGQAETYKDATDAYDAGYGSYEANVPRTGDEESLLPTTQLPKGKDPSPFVLGPMATGGR